MKITDEKLFPVELTFEWWGQISAEVGRRNRGHQPTGGPEPAEKVPLQWHELACAMQSSQATIHPNEKKMVGPHYGCLKGQ